MIRIAPSVPSLARATPVEAAKVFGARSSQISGSRNSHPSSESHAAPSDSKAGNARNASDESARNDRTRKGQPSSLSSTDHPDTPENADQLASEFHGALNRALAETQPAGPVAAAVSRNAKYPVPARSASALSVNESAVTVAPPAEEVKPLPFVLNLGLSAPDSELSASKKADTTSTSGLATVAGSAGSAAPTDEAKESLATGAQAFTARIQHAASVASQVAITAKKDTAGEPETPSLPASDAVNSQPQKILLDTPTGGNAAAATSRTESLASPSNNPIGVHSVQIAEEPVAPAAAPEPVRDISFQLPGARGLEVRVTDRAGELRVDVRSADPALTQDLRANLHDLVSGLEKKGFAAHVSHPGERAPLETAQPNGAGSSKDQSGNGQQGAFDHEQEQRQQHPDQRRDGLSAKTRAAVWAKTANFNLDNKGQ